MIGFKDIKGVFNFDDKFVENYPMLSQGASFGMQNCSTMMGKVTIVDSYSIKL